MREFTYTTKGIGKGLRPFNDWPTNGEGLFELRNLKCTEYGVRDWDRPDAAFSANELLGNSLALSPPMPQLFKGKRQAFLANRGQLFSINTSNFTLTRVLTYDAYTPGLQSNIISDGVWDFLDFGDSFMFFNGTSWVYKTGHASVIGETERVHVVNTPVIRSGCTFHGRAIYGGFSGSPWNSEWEAMLRSLVAPHIFPQTTETGLKFSLQDLGQNFVWWTSVGGGDLTWLIYPRLAFTGAFDGKYTDKLPYFIQALNRGDWGFMPMDFAGEVIRVVPMGHKDLVAVFGADGICFMQYNRELTTFGKYKIDAPRINQRGAVCASNTDLIYIDDRSQLWRLGEGGFQLLGYSEYLSQITDGEVNIFYDESEDDFYIIGTDKAFIFNTAGMSEIRSLMTGILCGYTPSRVATFTETGVNDTEDTEMLMTSHVLDGGTRAQKTVMQIEVELSSGSADTISVAIDYRYKHNTAFQRTAFVPLNDEGIAQIPVVCLEFRWVVKSTDYRNTVIGNVRYSVQYDDSRTTYGLRDNAN